MHHPTFSSRATRVALLLAVVAMLVPLVPARGASSVSMEARPMLGGRYDVGGWAAIAVTLVNEAEPVEGFLSAETRSGTMRRFVEMPAGARKAVTLYVQPEAFQRRITVRYEEPNGVVESVVELRVLEQVGSQVAVVGDGAGNVRPQLGGIEDGRPESLDLGIGDLPERPEPLDALSGIVWATDSTALSDGQRRSLERWVAGGGQLVVLGGADWQVRTDAFVDLLPLQGLSATDGVPLTGLADWTGVDEPAAADATVASGTLHPDGRALVSDDDGTPLISMRPVGAGRVIFVGPDLATEAHRGWTGGPILWSRLMPSSVALEQFWGGGGPGFPAREEAENAMSQALGNVPSLEVPPAELLLAVIVGYILLIGPITYVVLRRLDRRELAWITAPILVVLFSACSYGIGSTLKGGDIIVNQISLIHSSSAGRSATVQAYAGIFSPQRQSFDLSVEADALMAQLRPSNGMGGQAPVSTVVAHQGDPGRLEGLSIGVFGFEGVRADAVVDYEPALSVTWSHEDGDLSGTVTNNGDEPLADVAFISASGGTRIGDLAPGEETTFELQRNFNGSSASDGVYGFGGFGGGEAEQVSMLRRQVIDSLVGYGGMMPGMDIGITTGRGPYLIGWRETPGPLPVAIDDVAAQRLDHTVEVIAVRPQMATGEVTIEPAQMAVSVVERTGDASDVGSGMMMMTDGSATFGIALPLEASGMSVTELEILAGPDPGMVIVEQGGFGGMWPPGFSIELRNAQTGEWTELGDLSQESRFEIDDPTTAMDRAGRIEVRVTGEGINPNMGSNTVFVSARASGVIDE